MKTVSIKTKIVFLVLAAVTLVTVGITGTAIHQINELSRQEIATFRDEALAQKKAELKNYVDLALASMGTIYQHAAPDDLDAQKQAASILRHPRYGKEGYYFVYSYDGVNKVLGPKPELEGKNLLHLQDAAGNSMIKDLIAIAKRGGGHYQYLWDKPSTGETVPKLSYVVGLDKWQWMIGTGFYIDDIDRKVASMTEAAQENVQQTVFIILALAIAFIAVVTLASLWVVSGMTRSLKRAVAVLQAIAKGDLTSQISVKRNDETGQLLQTMVAMQDQLKARTEEDHRQTAESNRIRQALDDAAANVMMADLDHKVIYANRAMASTYQALRAELRHILPGFNANTLIGAVLDTLHPEPAQQRHLLDNLSSSHEEQLMLGSRIMRIVLSPALDDNGTRLGTVVEWTDLTEQLANERQIADAAERERSQAAALQAKVDALLAVVKAAAAGDLRQAVPVKGSDAIGQMGEGLEQLLDALRKSLRGIGHHAHTVAGSAEELTAVSGQMNNAAEGTAEQAGGVSAAAEQVSSNIDAVATAADEMSASIREIAQHTAEAARIAAAAVAQADGANATVRKLGASSASIGQVVKVITSIAEQTNLLALNATIEAARAGEAGKGFAVVANEVKELAKETAKATDEISQKIGAIQTDTSEAVSAIDAIGEIIGQINALQTTVAGAVEEQTATTNEISRRVAEAAQGSGEISRNITQVAEGARSALGGTREVQGAAAELAQLAAQLQQVVARFQVEDQDAERAKAA